MDKLSARLIRMGYQNPDLRDNLRPILAALRVKNSASFEENFGDVRALLARLPTVTNLLSFLQLLRKSAAPLKRANAARYRDEVLPYIRTALARGIKPVQIQSIFNSGRFDSDLYNYLSQPELVTELGSAFDMARSDAIDDMGVSLAELYEGSLGVIPALGYIYESMLINMPDSPRKGQLLKLCKKFIGESPEVRANLESAIDEVLYGMSGPTNNKSLLSFIRGSAAYKDWASKLITDRVVPLGDSMLDLSGELLNKADAQKIWRSIKDQVASDLLL